jgi:hypothetical protein
MSLNDANKRIIRDFVQVLQQLRQPGQPKPAHQPAHPAHQPAPQSAHAHPAPQPAHAQPIELVYRAEDLQNERASEFDRNLREKQAEMDSFLTLKKPADVSFKDKDKGVPDDKPIGDEMSRLIAQELADRERELVQLKPEDIKKAQQWIGTTASAATSMDPQNVVIKKSVSFSEDGGGLRRAPVAPLLDQFELNANEHADENFEQMDVDIFSKFKKLSEPSSTNTNTSTGTTDATDATDATITMQQIYNKLIELEQRMDARHTEIMAYLKGSS